jgi:two-component sensor histidine kinase
LVDLTSLIEDEFVAHAAREGEQVRFRGPDVKLDAKAAERMSLAVHELTTNAVKHGALSSSNGRIDVRWELKGSNGKKELEFEWTESGVDLNGRAASPDGFGMELLRESLPYDLNARTEIDLRPEGVRFRLTMPLKTAD